MPVDPDLLRRRLRALEKYLAALKSLRKQGRAAFVRDEAVQSIAERNAQLLIQTCIDIAVHIVSGIGQATPESYAEALALCCKHIGLEDSAADQLAAAARLRNVLVHMYLDLDHGRLYDELDWIDTTALFASKVEEWLEKLESSNP